MIGNELKTISQRNNEGGKMLLGSMYYGGGEGLTNTGSCELAKEHWFALYC